jgi:glycosyltransferase involved in cell wall biosynthesis
MDKGLERFYELLPLQKPFLSDNTLSTAPKVSVLVATYQHAPYISHCLNGILQQKTNFDIEIIVGEDESNDGTREICIDFAKKYPDKIKLFLRKRSESQYFENASKKCGFNGLWNLVEAKGKYVAWCEGDDIWTDPLKLQKQVDLLDARSDLVMCFTNIQHINDKGQYLKTTHFQYPDNEFSFEQYIAKVFPPTLSTIFKKDAFPAAIPYQLLYVFNRDMFIKALVAQHGKVIFLKDVTAAYRIHGGGIYSSSSNTKKMNDKLNTFKVMYHYFDNSAAKTNILKAYQKALIKYIYFNIRNLNFKEIFTGVFSLIKSWFNKI